MVRELVKSNNDGMQMTVATGADNVRPVETGAPSTSQDAWSQIDWACAERQVFRLQMRIAKATQMGRWNKVKALQHLLTRSFNAKALAVKRVTSNAGKKDGRSGWPVMEHSEVQTVGGRIYAPSRIPT